MGHLTKLSIWIASEINHGSASSARPSSAVKGSATSHWGPRSSAVDQNTSPPARSTPVTAEEAGIWLYNKKEDGANLCVLEVQGENVRLETEGGFSWGKEYITVRAMRYTFPGLHAALTKLTGSEIVSTEIAVSRTQVLAVECADGTRYYSDSQQVERFIAGENPDGTVRYGYGTEEQYGHDFKKG